jgi:hypothetical protein
MNFDGGFFVEIKLDSYGQAVLEQYLYDPSKIESCTFFNSSPPQTSFIESPMLLGNHVGQQLCVLFLCISKYINGVGHT